MQVKLKVKVLLLMLMLPTSFSLTGCGPQDPIKAQLQDRLQAKIPQYWKVNSVDVKSRKLVDSSLEAQEETHFKARVQLQEDLYAKSPANTLMGISYLMGNPNPTQLLKTEGKGKTTEIYGTATSKLVAQKWKVSDVKLENSSIKEMGLPYQNLISQSNLLN
jgi:hypothetical protein